MGLLSFGTPLDWKQAKEYRDHVRLHGINQFLAVYHRLKNQQTTCLLWGDEVEYMVISYDDTDRNARLSLRVSEILEQLTVEEEEVLKNPNSGKDLYSAWRPEYGRYMLEGTPGKPYGNKLRDLLQVEPNMRLRRRTVMAHMQPNEAAITITSFPRLGSQDVFLDPHYEPIGSVSRSLFVPDEVINPHARFPTLTANIRSRRGSKVAINVPIFHDIKTPKPFIDPNIRRDRGIFPEDKEAAEGAALPDHIYMDAMVFGMGCCCLQITFQACNIRDARLLYDQLATLGPIMLALTAAAPIWRGYLADIDCRWNVIAGSVDDRTKEERSLEPLKKDRFMINKSRYDSIDCYISTDERLKPEYNDLPLVYDPDIFKKLTSNGIDDLLAKHIAHLFIRDPLVVYKELIDQDDNVSTDHFENIQSTNWQTMRFKPPPPNSNIGWRVEFRSMEVQITDFENAAFAIFIALVVRVILSFQLNLYIPISKVDENMQVAHVRGAVLGEKFWFRKNVIEKMPNGTHTTNGCCGKYSSKAPMQDTKTNGNHIHQNDNEHNNSASTHNQPLPVKDEYTRMTIDEIINGKDAEFPGIIPLIHKYLDYEKIDFEMRQQLNHYLAFVQQRANGTLQTTATWIREFVHLHPDYEHNSVVSKEINYDLMKRIQAIQEGRVHEPKLLGNFSV